MPGPREPKEEGKRKKGSGDESESESESAGPQLQQGIIAFPRKDRDGSLLFFSFFWPKI